MKKILFIVLLASSINLIHPQAQTIVQKLDEYIQAHTDLGYFSGSVLVAQNDTIILSKGYGMCNYEHNVPNTAHTRFKLSSLTKPFVSLSIMQLQEKGLLKVTDLLSKYIPDYPRGREITLHHLLSHTSGIQNYTLIADFNVFKKQPHTLLELIEHFKYRPLYFEPSSSYKYSNSNYALLAYIIEKVSGMKCADYVMENICKPVGMHNTGIEKSEDILTGRATGYTLGNHTLENAEYLDSSVAIGLGFLYTTVEDMYLFDRALYTDQLASFTSLNAMFKPYTYIGDKKDNVQYGYGWATIEVDGRHVKKHLGDTDGFTTAMYRFPEENIFIIVLSNFQQLLKEPFSFDLAHIIFATPYEMPQEQNAITVDTQLFDRYCGTYSYKTTTYTVSQKNNRLYLKQPDKPPYELVPKSNTAFSTYGVPIEVEFSIDSAGNAIEIITKAFGKSRRLRKVR
jgi:CubicO group peptidase (beta-lactamase class C family)